MPDEPLSTTGDDVSPGGVRPDADMVDSGMPECMGDVEALIVKIAAIGLTAATVQELKIVLEQAQVELRSARLMFGVLCCADLVSLLDEHIDSVVNDASALVIADALALLPPYVESSKAAGHDTPVQLLWALNNIRACLNRRLLTERVFALPVEYSAAKTDSLVSVVPALEAEFKSSEFYRSFSEILGGLYRDDNPADGRARELEKLALLLRASINLATHEYAAVFWFTCSAFASCIGSDQSNLMPSVRHILRQIDLVIKHFVVDVDTPVLSDEGIESVERILINMLCFIAEKNPDDPIVSKLEQQFETKKSLLEIDTQPAQGEGVLLVSSIQSAYRLIARTKLAIDAAARTDTRSAGKVLNNLSCLVDACAVLVCTDGAQHMETAMANYRRFVAVGGSLSDRDSCATALMHAERSMLELFPIQLSTVTHGSGSLSFRDDALLDELIVRELLVELRSIDGTNIKLPDSVPEVSVEWLRAVLLDVVSAAAFLSDSFLYEELFCLQSDSAPLLSEAEQSFVQQLLLSVKDYLSAYEDVSVRTSAQEHVHVSLAQLKNSVTDLPLVFKPGLPEAGRENDSLAELLAADVNKPAAIDLQADHPQDESNDTPAGQAGTDTYVASVDFGNDCNTQVDIIQHALDTALGSSGNLAPDRSVLSALENLRGSVDNAGLVPLQRLIEPLSRVLSSAESSGSTLSQSDTLLVQEAIVAITLGVDSLVNGKPMSALVDDVAQRMTAVAIDGSHNVRGEYESAGLVDIFVEEAEDLLQRLFELFQRWRGAPRGGSRLHSDICRLLHTIKGSADTVGLNTVASLVHYLESALLGVQGFSDPTVEYFDLVLETVESLSDDIDRVRNGEQPADRGELILKLQAISLAENNVEIKPESLPLSDTQRVSDDVLSRRQRKGSLSSRIDRSADRMPAFGSAKYFHALELSERQLKRSNSDSLDQHEELQRHIAEMRSSLQSTRYLLAGNEFTGSLNKSIDESLSDLEGVQRNLSRLSGQMSTTDDKRQKVIQDLTALVSSADRVAVDSIRMRMESIVQKSADVSGKRVTFQMHGSEVELDRKLFADLVSPLEQLLTNAVVHGIESLGSRIRQGKSDRGAVELSFNIDTETLVISVSDDGAGIDIDEVRRRLAGYPELGESSSLSNIEVLGNLVVQGVSTAPRTDRTSGRGVGLDVVVQSVYSHKGVLAVTTTAGKGTEFKLSIPLLSIPCPVLIVEVAKQYYAIDCRDLIEVQGLLSDAAGLGDLLGHEEAARTEDQSVVSCQVDGQILSLRVDSIIGRRILNFNYHDSVLSTVGWCSGSAILDGRYIVLKLDMAVVQNLKPAIGSDSSLAVVPEVLIVDDSVTIRASFGRAMTKAGYGIHLARNGLEAIELLQATIPAVVILDLEMPEMNGFDVAAYIRSEKRLDNSRVIVVTSRPRHEIEDWLVSVRADGYFEKPCGEQMLAEAVAALL